MFRITIEEFTTYKDKDNYERESTLNLGKFKHGHDWIVKENFKQMKEKK